MDEYIPFAVKHKPRAIDEFKLPRGFAAALQSIAVQARLNTLLTGATGYGKSTMAKAIANSVSCPSDLLVVNSAADNGISYFRNEVRTFCQNNTRQQRKVVIIDDLDAINEQSQQVLRSTIDAFIDSVQFIATVTSEPKLIDGMASRFTSLAMPQLTTDDMLSIAVDVCAYEHVSPNTHTLHNIVDSCHHSPRGLLRSLDKMVLAGVDEQVDSTKSLCVAVDIGHYSALVEKAKAGDGKSALKVAQDMQQSGYSPIDILDGFFHALPRLHSLSCKAKYELTKIIARYVATCHACHTGSLQLKLFVLEIFNVVRM